MKIRPSIHREPDAISPTAHYTGHVWVRNGLSDPALATWEGRVLFEAVRPAMIASRALGGPTLEGLLLARHRVIDDLLAREIDAGRVSQVVEAACGMSPRGWRFSRRYGADLTYVEADLPAMAERKRQALSRIGSLSEQHRVADLDVRVDDGPLSIASIAGELDPARGLAILSEGLLTYYDQDSVLAIAGRFARTLSRFSEGRYLADLRLRREDGSRVEEAFDLVLSTFVRGRVYRHFRGEADAAAALRATGFDRVRLHNCDEYPAAAPSRRDPGAALVHVIEAAVSASERQSG